MALRLKWRTLGVLKNSFNAAFLAAMSPSLPPTLALGGGWGISETLRVAGAAALIFLAALLWVLLLKLRERQQNLALQDQLKREQSLSELGRKLSEAQTVTDAARIILNAADRFFGWDAAYLNLYSAEKDVLEPAINLDTIDGRRTEVPFVYPAGKPTAMARQIIDKGATLIRRDKRTDAKGELLPFGDKARLSASLMFVPIHGTRSIVGLVSIQSYTPNYYDEAKLQLLQGLADHCGCALERIWAQSEVQKSVEVLEQRVAERTAELTRSNALLEKSRDDLEQLVAERTAKLSRAVEELEKEIEVRRAAETRNAVLSRVGAGLSAATDFTAAGKVALDAADELLRWEAAYIHLYTPDFRYTVPILSFDVVEGERTQVFPISHEVSPRDKRIVDRGGELVNGPLPAGQPPFVPFGMRARPTASRLFVPMRSGGRVIGAMSAQSYQAEAYAEKDLALLQSLADFCGDTFERIQAELRMRHSEERFSNVFRSSPAPMSLTTLEQGVYLDVNESLTNLLGYTREEMLGKTSIQLRIWPDPEDRLKMAQQVLANKSLRNYQCRLRTKSGAIRTALASVERMDFRAEQSVILGAFHDITEALSLEAQLRQSQKMEAIGQLAAGVAHDFNNILTIIQGHVGLLLEDPAVSGDMLDSLRPVATAAERAALLTKQLLAFSRKQVMQMRAIDINDVVSDAAAMLHRLLGENIKLTFNYSRTPAWAEGDTSMLEQVIVNLAVNARDAMPAGGCLSVVVELPEVAPEEAQTRSETKASRFVRVSVADTGRGMDEQTCAHLFEPFFTTKEVGRGTGLGLATVYGIIKQHRGWIDVESELGRGTTFRVYLPASGEAGASAVKKIKEPAVEEPAKPSRGEGETILVVEDEADLRELLRSLLEGFGYIVLEAEHGKEALDLWARASGKIDLLLTDVTMPEGISGVELAERFRKETPGLKVIFSSGYSAELFERRKIPGLKEGLNFLPKPYQPETLANIVRKCLDS